MRHHTSLVLRISALVALVVVTMGAIAIAANDDSIRAKYDRDAQRAADAAARATGGQVVSVDFDAERGATWEVEVTKSDGSRLDVLLDRNFHVIHVGSQADPYREPASSDKPRDDGRRDSKSYKNSGDRGDREQPVPAGDAEEAARVALKEVGGGTVQDVDLDSEGGAKWEVEIIRRDGSRVDVLLDSRFNVLDVGGEQEPSEGSDDRDEDHDSD